MSEQTYKELTGQTVGDLMKEYEDVKRRIDIYYGTLESRLENYEGTAYAKTVGDLMKEYEDVKRRIDIYYGTLESRLENYEGTAYGKTARSILDAMRHLEFGSKEWIALWCISNDILAK